MPLKQPTIPVESRIDIRILATLAKHFQKTTRIPLTRSRVVQQACIELANLLSIQNESLHFTSIEKSLLFLEEIDMGINSRALSKTTVRELVKEVEHLDDVDESKVDAYFSKVLEKMDEKEALRNKNGLP